MTSKINLQRLVWLLAALAAFVPLSIDTYLPSLPEIARDLHTGEGNMQMTIGVFLAGLCTGMLIYGPLSDRYGRRRFLLWSIVLYMLASTGCALVSSIEQLIIFRFLQALGGAGALVLARTVVRDLYPLTDAARILSLMHVIAMIATLIAPILGTYLVLLNGWRTIFITLLILAGGCLVATFLQLPESLSPSARNNSIISSFSHYLSIIRDPLALCYIFSMALSVGGMFAFITASPFLYIRYFEFSARSFSLLFGLNIIGIIVATLINARYVRRVGPIKMLGVGSSISAIAGVLLLIIGGTGWGQPGSLILCILLFMGISGLIGANCVASLMSIFPNNAGSAVSLAISLQFAGGSLFSWLVSFLADGTPRPMCLMIGISSMASLGCYLGIEYLRAKRQRNSGCVSPG